MLLPVEDGPLAFRPVDGGSDLPGSDEAGEFADEIARIADAGQALPWCAYLGWEGQRAVVFASFKGPPDANGDVEIGYLTFAAHEGRGHAKAAAAFLVEVAREGGARSVIADTLPQDSPSTGVLVANGFARDGWAEDEDIGRAWRWRFLL
ncbi:MAG: GNAT family N-acetyltransferase [Erythrobacter sp.]